MRAFFPPAVRILLALALLAPPSIGTEERVTFHTDPPGARVELLTEGGEWRFLCYSGKPAKVSFTRLAGSVVLRFSAPRYSPRRVTVAGAWFRTSSSYPARGAVVLESALRKVTFLTDPPGARICPALMSNPRGRDFIGVTGAPVTWDQSQMALGKPSRVFLAMDGYREREVLIGGSEFDGQGPSAEYFYPESREPLRLEPLHPLVPLLHWARARGPLAPFLLFAFLFLCWIVVARIVVPGRRAVRERLERAARWEELASRASGDDPMVGRRFGSYRLLEKIGSGGMAAVYRAVPESTLADEESVAVKVMRSEISQDDGYCRRFRREMRIGGELSHPAIVKVIDYGDRDGLLYLVMDLVRGRTLRESLREGGLSPAEFWELFRPLLEGVAHAHGKGVIHRDLKPENVMVTEGGAIRVMDFGLARGAQASVLTATGTTLGTPAYMSPDQARSGAVDARSDQYSLGVMAYEMLTGELPFDDPEPVNILLKHITEEPRPLRELRPDMPEELERVVMRMMEKDPDKRFASVAEARGAFEEALGRGRPR